MSVKHYSNSDPEIVLRAVEQSRRIVINLNDADIDSIACANIDTTPKCSGPSRLLFREIRGTRTRRNGDADVGSDLVYMVQWGALFVRTTAQRYFGPIRLYVIVNPGNPVIWSHGFLAKTNLKGRRTCGHSRWRK